MKPVFSLIILAMITSLIPTQASFVLGQVSYIERTKKAYQAYFTDARPQQTADAWYLPFPGTDRNKFNSIRIISTFASPRTSFLKGHFHTAIDLYPKYDSTCVSVYPIASGVVCSIHLGPPHRTVVIRHLLPNGQTIFSSYKHLCQIDVSIGNQVSPQTKLGRLYTRAESRKFKGNFDHLHLEIRKDFSDFGCASWLTMTKEELNFYFINPLDFLTKYLSKEPKKQKQLTSR